MQCQIEQHPYISHRSCTLNILNPEERVLFNALKTPPRKLGVKYAIFLRQDARSAVTFSIKNRAH